MRAGQLGRDDAAVWAVGRAPGGEGPTLWASTWAERRGAAAGCRAVLAAHGIGPGDGVVVVSLMSHGVQFVPLDDALAQLGAVPVPVDATARDARRLLAVVEAHGPAAVVGVGAATLEGLAALGSGAAALRPVPLVLADPRVHPALVAGGLDPSACEIVGPLLALECPARRGVHLPDGWGVSIDEEEITLHAPDHRPVRTGLRRVLVRGRCACGAEGPRLVLP